MTNPGEPVSHDQKVIAARRMALENLQKAEEQVVALAGWIGPYRHPNYATWRDPMNGRDTSTIDALAQIRKQIETEWAPQKSKSLI